MKKLTALLLSLVFLCMSIIPVLAFDVDTVDAAVRDVAAYLYNGVSNPQVGSVGGEWTIIGLSRSGIEIPEAYYQGYYENICEYVTEKNGILHDRKYTEYSRVITALTSIGKEPTDVAGYNLLIPLGDYEKTVWQGLNGPIWALIALDSGNYEMPQNPSATVQATREMYLNRILDCQLSDGGWSLFGGTATATAADAFSDPDVTGMALQALSKYQDNPRVSAAIDRALNTMSAKQDAKGGFSSWGTENAESCVQMLVALCELGISIEDPRFVKNGYTILDHLLTYYTPGEGFSHTSDGSGSDLMATEQGFYGLVAVKRVQEGKSSLYTISDPLTVSDANSAAVGLAGKHADVQKKGILHPGKTFEDIQGHENRTAIEALASRGIINGQSDNCFAPDATMTRAEFATIIVNGLGLPIQTKAVFTDVREEDWFFDYVNTAYSYGIIKGISTSEFYPNGTITREEAAVMVVRAARLCGMDTELTAFAARDILSVYFDYVTASDWAMTSLAFCFDTGILPEEMEEIQPKAFVTRAEIASMLYGMLSAAKLL